MKDKVIEQLTFLFSLGHIEVKELKDLVNKGISNWNTATNGTGISGIAKKDILKGANVYEKDIEKPSKKN